MSCLQEKKYRIKEINPIYGEIGWIYVSNIISLYEAIGLWFYYKSNSRFKYKVIKVKE